ncbi:MAG: type II toxin-antitoxin system VapC family toxin [Chloroflexi bacterium]|nr:type II toxin-antitoxin system VapC family toxin [Chloroflexota bacterium]
MNELVLDASVILKWFATEGEEGFRQARAVRDQYEAGRLLIVAPSLMFLEVLNIAGRRWSWAEPELLDLAGALDDLGFDVAEPELRTVAAWTARGLTAYDSAYLALAEERGVRLLTDDQQVLRLGADVARPLAEH